MPLFALGISHKTAPVAVRERVSFAGDAIPAALAELLAMPGVDEAVVISTCNRTEIYCALVADTAAEVEKWLIETRGDVDSDLRNRLYRYHGDEVVRHLLRVAGGLDSMMLGEPQILGQIKQAYEVASGVGAVGPLTHRLFQHAFSVAKQIRSDTAIGESPVSIAFAAIGLARQIFADFTSLTAVLVGAGEMIELTARHLNEQGVGRMVIANRHVERAQMLAAEFEAYAIDLAHLPKHLDEADIVVTATASPEPLLDRPMAERALSSRKHRPMFMVDLGVPRNIAPAVSDLQDAYLYTVDDLGRVVDAGLKSRRAAAAQAEEIVAVQVGRFGHLLRTLDAVPTIRGLRTSMNDARDRTLERARQMIDLGHSPEDALDYLANTLTNRLLHTPTARLRKAGEEGRAEVIKAAQDLFDIEDKES
ncbi:MAG TPA: glutamyl-tRNA reductase [Gammaproteobacteria bacterium]|nr:glutamyl-tRNA reductase [Gammaproteobacteria bacterium]